MFLCFEHIWVAHIWVVQFVVVIADSSALVDAHVMLPLVFSEIV